MPFTPFHWGITLLLYALLFFLDPVSLFLGSTVPDFEGFLVRYLKFGTSNHGILHTLIGGLGESVLVFFISFLFWREIDKRLDPQLLKFLNRFHFPPNPSIIALSALIGVFSNVLIDAIIYPDLYLFWPISTINPLLGLVTTPFIYLICFISAVLGIIILNMKIRKLTTKNDFSDESIYQKN
ncbi:MAG: DUF4184 family protein [Candidatus Hermodarchaeota archaeon]